MAERNRVIDSPAQLLASCSAQCGSFFYPLFECVTYTVDSVGIPVVARAFFKIVSGKKISVEESRTIFTEPMVI